jgi:ketosteroid isomerase-like protein
MSEASNRAVIEDYYRAMGEGDFAHVIELHAPDLVCWMLGTSLVSGRFVGCKALYDHMGEYVLGTLVSGTESYIKECRVALADNDFVVGLMHGGLPAKDGGRYDQYYLQIFRLENGLIAEIVEMYDTVMVETVLMRHKLATARPRPAVPFDFAARAIAGISRQETVRVATALGAALAEDNSERVAALLATNALVRVLGSTPRSGHWKSIASVYELFAGGMRGFRVICADNNAACLLMRSSKAGYDQQFGIVVGMDGNKIGDLIVWLDTVEAERALFDNRIEPAPSISVMPPFDVMQAMRA